MKPTPPTDGQLLLRFWEFLKPYKRRIVFALFVVPVMTGTALLQPYLLKVGIDDCILQGDVEKLQRVSLALFGLVVGNYLLNGLQSYQLQLAVVRAIGDLRERLYGHVMGQSARFFDRRSTGSLLTRSTTDVEGLGEMVTMGMIGMFADLLTIIGIVVTMLFLNAELTLLTFSLSPLVVLIVNIFRKKLRVYSVAIRKNLSRLNGYLAEHILGVEVVRVFGRDAKSMSEFKELNFAYLDAYRRSNWYDASLYALMDGLSSICVALMLWFGGARYLEGDPALSLGLLVAFVEYTTRLFVPVREFSGKVATLQRSLAALQRIFGLLDDNAPIEPGASHLKENEPLSIQIKDLSFRYRADSPLVLKDISLDLTPGKVLALVGRTGSGKSTIGKLLTRTYDGYEGSIQVNGVELSQVDVASIRSKIGMIHQDVFLFSGTIRDNITLGATGIGDSEIEEAATMVGAAPFIEQLQDTYGFEVTEQGANLSAGQAQLIAFARSMARGTPVLVLDEATSNVDPLLEETIQEAIEKMMRSRTVLVVAHRLSTIQGADEILVMDQGTIAERGTHEELLEKEGVYANLIQNGFGEPEELL